MAEFCFDSYDSLMSNAEIIGLESEKWLAVKGMEPWDPAVAREQCAQAVRRISCSTIPAPSRLVLELTSRVLVANDAVQ